MAKERIPPSLAAKFDFRKTFKETVKIGVVAVEEFNSKLQIVMEEKKKKEEEKVERNENINKLKKEINEAGKNVDLTAAKNTLEEEENKLKVLNVEDTFGSR